MIVNTNEKNKTVHSIAELVAFINRDDAIVIAVILQRLGLFYFAFFTEKEQIKNELGTGVYLFIDNYQVISYVGKADEMKSRIRNGHEKLENEEIITINTWDIVIAGRLEIILERLLLPGKNRTVPGTIPGRRRK